MGPAASPWSGPQGPAAKPPCDRSVAAGRRRHPPLPRNHGYAQGNTVSDANPEARARHISTELTPVRCNFMGDEWVFMDCPGAVDLTQEAHHGMMDRRCRRRRGRSDARTYAGPRPDLQVSRRSENSPHILFINKMDSDIRSGARPARRGPAPVQPAIGPAAYSTRWKTRGSRGTWTWSPSGPTTTNSTSRFGAHSA